MKKNPVTKRGLYRQWEPDPRVIDASNAIWQSGKSFAAIARDANLSVATVEGIAYLETKRPQNYTIERLLPACGIRQVWIWETSGETFDFLGTRDAMRLRTDVLGKMKAKRAKR